MGPYSVVPCVRCLIGQSLCSAADAGKWGERGYGDGSTRLCVTQQYRLASMAVRLSSTGTSPDSLLPHSPSSFHSQQQPSPWDCSTVPKLQLPAAAPSRGPAFLSRVCIAAARTVWFSFHLGSHRWAVSLSALIVSPLTQAIAQMWGSYPCCSSPTHPG